MRFVQFLFFRHALGHSSVNVTRIYTATTESVFQKRIDRFIEQKILGVQHNISYVVN